MLGDDGIFLYPTHPTAAPLHHEPLVKPFNFSYTGIINVISLPATACPLGLNKQGLPIGLQVSRIIELKKKNARKLTIFTSTDKVYTTL